MQARFLRLSDRIVQAGLESLGEPHVKHLEGKLWELRLTGHDGIARALYVTAMEWYFENEPKPGTPEADRFDLLALIVEDYERKRRPIEQPETIEAIRYRMETGGYTQADLGRLLGSRQRASDILTRKRPLTMRMAWRLHREWGIPAEALIAPPRTRARKSAA